MAFYLNITFPEQNISLTETIQHIIKFELKTGTADVNWDSADYNLKIDDNGERDIEFDIENASLVPAESSLSICDPDKVLDDLFFGYSATAQNIYKKAQVIKKINGVENIKGTITENSISRPDKSEIVAFDYIAETKDINSKAVFGKNGNPLNPLTITDDTNYLIVDVLEKIFNLSGNVFTYPDSIHIYNKTKFYGLLNGLISSFALWNIPFTSLEINSRNLCYDNNISEIASCGDILKLLAQEFACYTGIINTNKAFMKRLFSYDPDNIQTVTVQHREKTYGLSLIDYVTVKQNFTRLSYDDPGYSLGDYTVIPERQVDRFILAGFTELFDEFGVIFTNVFANISNSNYFGITLTGGLTIHPDEDSVYSNNGSTFKVIGINTYDYPPNQITMSFERISGTNPPSSSGTFTKVSGVGDSSIGFDTSSTISGGYYIYACKDTEVGPSAFFNQNHFLATFLMKFRGDIENCRVDKFILRGISYDPLKDFNYLDEKFQPIKWRFHDAQGYTECDALCLGELV